MTTVQGVVWLGCAARLGSRKKRLARVWPGCFLFVRAIHGRTARAGKAAILGPTRALAGAGRRGTFGHALESH
jgi:hypothetical protein